MSETKEIKGKRAVFNESDAELLVELVKKHSKVLQNGKTNAATPQMKSQVK
jgi:Myb/SANT-like DNA-binding domain